MATILIDPVTRIEGHMKVEVTLDSNNVVSDVKSSGTLYRDFENFLLNRVPKDAAIITQRVCGVCPIPHAVASSIAIEKILNFNPNLQALLLRNLILGANFIDSNILHFYHLTLMDYIKGPEMSPWVPTYEQDLRFTQVETDGLIQNYVTALRIRRIAHEMVAKIAGKMPHAASITPGGVTSIPDSADINYMKETLIEIQNFINTTYKNDIGLLASKYNDYYNVGKGYGNLIAFGVFDTNLSGAKLFPAGTVANGTVSGFSEGSINEYVKYSWYSSPSGVNPATGSTTPDFSKAGAYTWLKAPRYNSVPYEAGPLARTWVSGDYNKGVSVIDRHYARYVETAKIATAMKTWLDSLVAGAKAYTNVSTPSSGSGIGLTEAPRGALGHWVSVSSSKVSRYQIISPTCWNASPKDDLGNNGPVEKAIIGTKIQNIDQPIEIVRIIHSFDPCVGCSVHMISNDGEDLSKFILGSDGIGVCMK